MKKEINKIKKGVFAILTIKMFLLILFVLIQSCQVEDNIESYEKEVAMSNFENQLEKTKPLLSKFIIDNNLSENNKINKTNNSRELELEMSKKINPLISSSIELIKSYGVTSSELTNSFYNLTDERIVLVGMILYASEKERLNNSNLSTFNTDLFVQSSYANINNSLMYKMPKWVECGIAALGADFLFSAGVEGASKHNKWSKKALLKLIGKVGSRMLGPIGAGIAVVTFVGCMW